MAGSGSVTRLFDVNGNSIEIGNAVTPPNNQSGLMISGLDKVNNLARFLNIDANGNLSVLVQLIPAGAASSIAFGQANTGGTSNVQVALRATTYTEQTTAAQRSLKSSSANDANGGTGAQTVQITYYDASMNGPFTETVTMNGTTAVPTVNSNICFIEKMLVLTSGSTGSNQGTISLYVNNVGTGTVIGSIAVGTIVSNGNVGDNRTLWAHHYVSAGKTASITTISAGTTGNQNGVIYLKSAIPTVANATELKITESIVTNSGGNSVFRIAGIPLQIVGPARVTLYAVSSGTNTVFLGGFEYSEM